MIANPNFRRQVMAVDRVEKLLTKIASTLDAKGLNYAVVGENAVAAWVATVDDGAVRATKDVDILLRRDDLAKASAALEDVDLVSIEVMGVHMFVDRDIPNPKTGAHVVFANERVRPHYAHPAPGTDDSVAADGGFRVIALQQLVEMKLQANRFVDRVHIQDMTSVGLIDQPLRDKLPDDLRTRLETIDAATEE
jgi:hypothetical protein